MKKTIFLTMILMTTIISSSFSTGLVKFSPGIAPNSITSLVVNADVTIVLINDSKQSAHMNGDAFFMEQVSVRQIEGRLVVDAVRNKDFKTKGVIYVPSADLREIKINSAAYIRSSNTLQVPDLRILVNGECKVHLTTIGKVDFVENDTYEFDYQVWELPTRLPNIVAKKKE